MGRQRRAPKPEWGLDPSCQSVEPGKGSEAFEPIWAAWNHRSPEAQASDALRADQAVVERFERLDPQQRESLHLALFGMDLDTTGLARMRLGEHAIHTWDVAVTLDLAATVAQDAVELLVDTLDGPARRSGRSEGKKVRLHVSTTSPERHFTLDIGETVDLVASDPDQSLPELRLPAEALVRLVYGRLDAAHTPPVETRDMDLDELRQVFPGF